MEFPTAQEVFFNTGLYNKISFDKTKISDLELLYYIICFNKTINCYCVECKENSVFHGLNNYISLYNNSEFISRNHESLYCSPSYPHNSIKREFSDFCELVCKGMLSLDTIDPLKIIDKLKNKFYDVVLYCSHDSLSSCKTHIITFNFYISDSYFMKVGQFPSFSDLGKNDLKKYQKILKEEKSDEFSIALGLFSHGVGIGSFVYLRRIFESLIEDAREEASKESDWNDETFQRHRMPDKIDSLKKYLPEFLVLNKEVYSILSSGIHGLSEDICKQHFPILKDSIEVILDEKIQKRDQEKKKIELSNSLKIIKSDILNK